MVLSNDPSLAVTVCGMVPTLIQLMVSPTRAFCMTGAKVISLTWISMVFVLPPAAGAGAGGAAAAPAAPEPPLVAPAEGGGTATPARGAPTTSVPAMPGWKLQT